ncbi:hypothetical protein SGFS_065220 [Streptomyces graminofaciens]|uniref:Hin recombinase n=1 Tax=Streptomyces graminofaciens TaxID=68212 RepID=A0ABN5VP31_9ACTN|nr:hypothetical protein [Streptomyces graminofaciens]BBC35228.1 hypothetical protein SGFS_065220 [Streptomyces graminofaciens]
MPTPQQRIWNQGYGGFNTPALRPQGWKKPKLTTAQREDIVRRLGEGEKSTDLAVEFGVSGRTVRRLRQYVRPS